MTEAEVGSLVSAANGCNGGAAWGDYDNDGDLDLFVTGGRLNQEKGFLYHNNGPAAGGSTFRPVTIGSPVNDLSFANECAWVDYDQDGFLDLFVQDASIGASDLRQNRLYRNNGNANRWLTVKCVGTRSPRMGTGAKVRAKATIRGESTWQLRLIGVGGTSWSDMSDDAHFGLGDATQVEVLRIEWPSGIIQELTNVPSEQFLTVTEAGVGILPWWQDLSVGSNLTFRATCTLIDASYQWRFNGADLLGATNAVLVLTDAHPANAGDYSVVARNASGSLTSLTSRVSLPSLRLLQVAKAPEGELRATVAGPVGLGMVVQASTNLATWETVFTNVAPTFWTNYAIAGTIHTNAARTGPFQFNDPKAGTIPWRFYRAVRE
jgi:hypothetical protein